MSILSDILGYQAGGRAAGSISDANIAAEHGVLNATGDAQKAIGDQLNTNAGNVNAAGSTATGQVNDAVAKANTGLGSTLSNVNSTLDPYLKAGAQGVSSLADYAASKPTFTAPTAAEAAASPGEQFQLQQGSEAINNSASASGLANSGNTLKALTQYGQGLASTYYQNAFNNAKDTFNTNQNTTLANLSTLAGIGQTASGQSTQAQLGVGGQQASNTVGAGTYGGNITNNNALFNATQGLAGQEYSGTLGQKGSQLAGDFAVGAGTAHAGGILSQAGSLASLGGDLAGLIPVGGIPMPGG